MSILRPVRILLCLRAMELSLGEVVLLRILEVEHTTIDTLFTINIAPSVYIGSMTIAANMYCRYDNIDCDSMISSLHGCLDRAFRPHSPQSFNVSLANVPDPYQSALRVKLLYYRVCTQNDASPSVFSYCYIELAIVMSSLVIPYCVHLVFILIYSINTRQEQRYIHCCSGPQVVHEHKS